MAMQEILWAGTEMSLRAALDADEAKTSRLAAGQSPDDADEEEDDRAPRLLEVHDGVAVISIKGALNNDAGFWNALFGMTGYPEIRDAVLAAANDPEVKQILLDVDSGGGAVAGVEDTAKLIRTVNDQVKPVVAYTDGTMASAAYWLGSSAGSVYSGKTAVVGSIGVICTHMERSQALADAGIGVTVVRSGKYKALANGVEKLTPEGKAQIQQIVDAADAVFVEAVSNQRGKSIEYVRENMAQGREFVGQSATDVGLVDGVSTFDKVMGDLQQKVAAASKASSFQPRGIGQGFAVTDTVISGDADMAKKALTEQDVAALAAGAAIGVHVEASTETITEAGAPATHTEAVAVVEPVTAEAETTPQNVDATLATVQLLSSQLKEKDEALIQARVELAKLSEFASSVEATHAPLLAIAAKSVGNMQVALGGSAMSLEGMSATAVLAEHQRLSEQFQSKFKVGGVAAVSHSDVFSEQAPMDALASARFAAVRFSK